MSNYYRYIYLDSTRNSFNNISVNDVLTSSYGDILKQNYPLTSSIDTHFYPNPSDGMTSGYDQEDTNRIRIKSLKSTFNKYKKYSSSYEYSSSYVDFENDNITLVNIPSIFYGQSLEKGSIKLDIYADGVLLSRIQDIGKNGELIQTTGSVQLNDKNIAGIVFYDEGIILLFGDDSLNTGMYTEDFYSTPTNNVGFYDNVKWCTWGISLHSIAGRIVRTSYDIEFNGVNKVPQLTLLTHANIAEINNSNNGTYIKNGQSTDLFSTGSNFVREQDNIEIKNIVKTPYESPVPNFHKETYISKILIYDKDRNIIGVAKLATPVRKTEDRSFTFKLKMNL